MSIKERHEFAANTYSSLLIGISKKSVQRIEPEMKRRICKSCHQFLVAGITCTVRIRKGNIIYKCHKCNAGKSFKATKDYQLWIEKPEAIVEVLNYTDVNK